MMMKSALIATNDERMRLADSVRAIKNASVRLQGLLFVNCSIDRMRLPQQQIREELQRISNSVTSINDAIEAMKETEG